MDSTCVKVTKAQTAGEGAADKAVGCTEGGWRIQNSTLSQAVRVEKRDNIQKTAWESKLCLGCSISVCRIVHGSKERWIYSVLIYVT